MKKIYVVTGASGFVGNNVVRELIRRGEKVKAFVRSKEKAEIALKGLDVEIFYGDICDPNALSKVFEESGEYYVLHTAGFVSIKGKEKNPGLVNANIGGTKNVIEICKKHNVKRLVHVSSVHAVPVKKRNELMVEPDEFNPKTVKGNYAKTKTLASSIVMDAVKNDGLDAVMVHPAGITGPNDYSDTHLTQMVLDYAAKRIPAAVVGGYNFVDVRDVAFGIIEAANKGTKGRNYLLSGEFRTVKEMLAILHNELNGKNIRMTMPMWAAKVSLPFLYLYFKVKGRKPLYTGYSLYTLASNSNFSNQRAKDELGYTARSLEESLHDTVISLRAQGLLK